MKGLLLTLLLTATSAFANLSADEWRQFNRWVRSYGFQFYKSYSWPEIDRLSGKISTASVYIYWRGTERIAGAKSDFAVVPVNIDTLEGAKWEFLGSKLMAECINQSRADLENPSH